METINTYLENLATSVDGEVITVDDNLGDGTEAWSDYRHYSEPMSGKVLEAIDASFPVGAKLLIRGKPLTTPRKYAKLYSTYRLGCGHCTRLGHTEEKCDKNNNSNKRTNISGSSPPPGKFSKY